MRSSVRRVRGPCARGDAPLPLLLPRTFSRARPAARRPVPDPFWGWLRKGSTAQPAAPASPMSQQLTHHALLWLRIDLVEIFPCSAAATPRHPARPCLPPLFAGGKRRGTDSRGASITGRPLDPTVSSIEEGASLPAGVHIAAFAEELRANANIKDRIYGITLTKYKRCFKGSDAVSWMVRSGHAQTRESAVRLGSMLVARRTIHHVLDEHDFRDKSNIFYRFFVDEMDTTVCAPEEAASIARALRRAVPIRDREWRRKVYRNCFVGSEAVDVLLRQGRAPTRAAAVHLGLQLERAGLFQHVRGKHRFKDAMLFYIFRGDEDGPGVEAWTPLQSRGINASWWVQPHVKANSIALTMRLAEDIVDSIASGCRGSAAASLAAVRSRVRREASLTVRGWTLASTTKNGKLVAAAASSSTHPSAAGGGVGATRPPVPGIGRLLSADDSCVRVFRKHLEGAFETTKTVGVVGGITALELVRQILHFKQRRRWDRSLASGRALVAVDCGDCDEACAGSGGIISCRSTQGNGFFGLGRWNERQKTARKQRELAVRLARLAAAGADLGETPAAASQGGAEVDSALFAASADAELEGEPSLGGSARPVPRQRSRSEVQNALRETRASSPALVALGYYFDDFGVLRSSKTTCGNTILDARSLPQVCS